MCDGVCLCVCVWPSICLAVCVVSGLVCCVREMEGVCLALGVCVCGNCSSVCFSFLSLFDLFDLRKLRGGKGREGRVSPAFLSAAGGRAVPSPRVKVQGRMRG